MTYQTDTGAWRDLGNGVPVPVYASGASGYDTKVAVPRPNNTTAYTAGDVVGGAYEVTNAGPVGGRVRVDYASLLPAIAAVPSGMTSFRRHFYSRTPPSALADNAPWVLATADIPYYLGYIDVGSPALPAASSGGLYVQTNQNSQPVQLESGSTSVFCYDVTNGGYTPAAGSEIYYSRTASLAI
jgi:hypothetical protein